MGELWANYYGRNSGELRGCDGKATLFMLERVMSDSNDILDIELFYAHRIAFRDIAEIVQYRSESL